MTVRPAAGLSRIGLCTADGCFHPLMLESFRGVRQVVLTTTDAAQQAADVALFLEEPGGGERYQHLGTVHLDTVQPENRAGSGAGRPDLVLCVSLEAGRVLTAVVTGPGGRGELRVALQRYSSGDATMRTAARLAGPREVLATGHLDGEPRTGPPAADAWLAAGGDVDAEAVAPVERFVYRCTSVLPLNAPPYDLARIVWLAERADLSRDEAELLRSICRRLSRDPDPARAAFAGAAMRSLDERAAGGAGADANGDDAPAAGARSAFEQRDYHQVLRLLHAARADGPDSGIPDELTDYWLDE